MLSGQTSRRRRNVTHVLPGPDTEGKMSFEATVQKRRSRRSFEDRAITQQQLGQLLWSVQGETDSRGLRAVPSAGATFPLEVYAIVGNVEGLEPGIYRYAGAEHSLEPAGQGDIRRKLASAALGQQFVAHAPATIAIAAVYERTAGRYGQRAVRYVHMEVGHAGQDVYLQCETLGLGTCAIGAFDDGAVKEVLGIPEEPLYLLPVGYAK
jgi:SagB-type dehydrogenase family enzyme